MTFEDFQDNELILDRYKPLETIGTGGYGTVFAAWDTQLKRRVAVKEIPFEPGALNGLPAGLQEAQTAALLTHPNIATVYDFITTDDCAYLIMEFVDGITLADIPSDALNDDTIAAIVKPMASAISHAHKNGVLHLDIKPRNILINHDGRVKIIDFGIAELSGLQGHGSASGGTIGYMPLEQLAGENTSEETDEWAFAAVVYELCTDEYPYANVVGFDASYDQMLAAQEKDEPSLLKTNDAQLDAVFAQALSTNPEERYESVKEFSTELMAQLGDVSEGRRELKEVVADLTDDETEEDLLEHPNDAERPPLFTGAEIIRFLGRLFVALLGGACIWQMFAYSQLVSRDTILIPIFTCLVAAATLELTPRLGGIITALALGVLLTLSRGAEYWMYGVALCVAAVVWWYFIGRKTNVVSLLSTLIIVVAFEVNLFLNTWFTTTFPRVFAGHLTTINISLAALYVLVSSVGVWSIIRRKEED